MEDFSHGTNDFSQRQSGRKENPWAGKVSEMEKRGNSALNKADGIALDEEKCLLPVLMNMATPCRKHNGHQPGEGNGQNFII